MITVTHLDSLAESELFYKIQEFLKDRGLEGRIVSTKGKLEVVTGVYKSDVGPYPEGYHREELKK